MLLGCFQPIPRYCNDEGTKNISSILEDKTQESDWQSIYIDNLNTAIST